MRLLSAFAATALLAGFVTYVAFTTLVAAPAAHAGAVPSPAAGWTTVFKETFTGRAGAAPPAADWFYDIGTGYGTGEIEQTTSSTTNAYLDGHGHLVLKATRSGGTWRSARIESTRDDFAAPPGGELEMTADIKQPRPAKGLGYWPAFWALGSPMRAGGGWPVSGEIDMMEDVNGLNQASQTLHDAAGSDGHPLLACRSSSCESGYHTYSVIVNRTNTRAEFLQFLMDGRVKDTITEAAVGATAWHEAIDHGFFIIFDLAIGGNYPDGECRCGTPTAATSAGASMSVAYVAISEKGGNSTPSAKATSTGHVTGIHGRCLDNQNALNTEGNPIGLHACGNSAGELWSAYSDRTLRTEGGCLDVAGGGTVSGTDVDWYPCNRTAAQVWLRKSDGEIVNPRSGLCLTDPRGDTAARLDIEKCTGSSSQRWSNPTGRDSGAALAAGPGSGKPPASFWGNTSKIPASKKVLEVEIINRTNGHFKNGAVYWSFDGTERSIAQQSYIDMPVTSAGRMYFYLGSKAARYADFIELNVSPGGINVDTSRVDQFSLKLALLVHSHSGSTQEIGENYATFEESRASTFRRFEAFVPAQFKALATIDAPYAIISPEHDPAFQPGGKYAAYFTKYASAHGARGVTTAQVFGCGGALSDNPSLCAALNRHVAQLPLTGQSNPVNFYKAAPANYYAAFWHRNAINGKQYGFAYDDDANQSSDISVARPQYMIIAIGW